MRVFIAIDIDESVRQGLADLQADIRRAADVHTSDAKWVDPHDMHLTLKFLGEIRDNESVEVCRIAEEAAAGHNRFDLDIETVGTFGTRVLWVGVGRGADRLARVQIDLERRLAEAGWPPENRPFTGHLTLCRIRAPRAGQKLADAVREYENQFIGTVGVDTLTVYHSQLTPKGPLYTALDTCALR